jgi:rubrerythrin
VSGDIVERLFAEMAADAAVIMAKDDEITRLRAERDAERALADQLAKALDRHGSHSLCTMLCSVCVTLAAHQEARRG